jgi:P pilus assembly chaperone PapD
MPVISPNALGRALFAALLCCGTARPAAADLAVTPVVVDLDAASDYRMDVVAANQSADETIYVQATIYEIHRPGFADERRVESRSPDDSGLLVAPRQMVLAPGQSKIVRIVAVKPPQDVDRVYRVEIKPVVGDIRANQSMIKVVVGYDALVLARPPRPTVKVVGRREGDTLVLANQGNSAGLLFDGRACPAQDACAPLPSRRLYAGNELRLTVPAGSRVSYRLQVDDDISPLEF